MQNLANDMTLPESTTLSSANFTNFTYAKKQAKNSYNADTAVHLFLDIAIYVFLSGKPIVTCSPSL